MIRKSFLKTKGKATTKSKENAGRGEKVLNPTQKSGTEQKKLETLNS